MTKAEIRNELEFIATTSEELACVYNFLIGSEHDAIRQTITLEKLNSMKTKIDALAVLESL